MFDGKCVYLILPSGAGSVLSNLCRKDVKKQSGAIVGHLGCLFCPLFCISIHLSSYGEDRLSLESLGIFFIILPEAERLKDIRFFWSVYLIFCFCSPFILSEYLTSNFIGSPSWFSFFLWVVKGIGLGRVFYIVVPIILVEVIANEGIVFISVVDTFSTPVFLRMNILMWEIALFTSNRGKSWETQW